MSSRKYDERLWKLQTDLLEPDDEPEADGQYSDAEDYPDSGEFEDSWTGEEAPDLYCDDGEPAPESRRRRQNPTTYSRKQGQKAFSRDEEEEWDEGEPYYAPDPKKAVRKRRKKNFFLGIVALLEIAAIGFIVLRFVQWLG